MKRIAVYTGFLVLVGLVGNAFAMVKPEVAPEPVSTSLFILGGAALAVRKFLKK